MMAILTLGEKKIAECELSLCLAGTYHHFFYENKFNTEQRHSNQDSGFAELSQPKSQILLELLVKRQTILFASSNTSWNLKDKYKIIILIIIRK